MGNEVNDAILILEDLIEAQDRIGLGYAEQLERLNVGGKYYSEEWKREYKKALETAVAVMKVFKKWESEKNENR